MPEMPPVVTGEPVASEWGNDIRDRTVQRYTGVTQRNTLHPSPGAGDLSYLADSGAVEVFHGGVWRGMLPTGVVVPYAGITPPAGFLVCNGSAVSRTTYAALYAAVGDTYGPGDGVATFNLPDLRGRFPLGVAATGTGSTLGAAGGEIDHKHAGASHTHTGPSHTHTVGISAGSGIGNTGNSGSHTHGFSGSDSFTTSTPTGANIAHDPGATAGARSDHAHTGSVTISGTTGATSHNHNTPDHTHANPATAAGGTAVTGAAGAVDGEAVNPPFLALVFIIRT